jgi:uncharacterized protein (DUF2384 family)
MAYDGGMSEPESPSSAEQLQAQLDHPTAEIVWKRALEVFGDGEKARGWMDTQRAIFDGRSPQQLVASGDAALLRRVLEALIRIEYGVFF